MEKKQYLKVSEIAKLLNVKKMTVYKWIWKGWLKAIKIGGILRIKPEDFDEFLKIRYKNP